MKTAGHLAIWARPGRSGDRLSWDPWRRHWVVACRAPPVDGAANAQIVALVAGWLDVPPSALRWSGGERSHAKRFDVEGLTDDEIERRLRRACRARERPRPGSVPR